MGTGTKSLIGTTKKLAIAPHHVPGHWCCTIVDLNNKIFFYCDSWFDGPYRARALSAFGTYVDHVHCEQGATVPISFNPTLRLFFAGSFSDACAADGVSCGMKWRPSIFLTVPVGRKRLTSFAVPVLA